MAVEQKTFEHPHMTELVSPLRPPAFRAVLLGWKTTITDLQQLPVFLKEIFGKEQSRDPLYWIAVVATGAALAYGIGADLQSPHSLIRAAANLVGRIP